jgi:CheY-like chemotaxis protein
LHSGVDDEPDVEALILQKFRRQMRDGAISFLFARDGVEALAALEANSAIELIVADINMPRMDGLSLLQRLQENEPHVCTIIVSAYGDMANIRAAMNRGAFDFVTKPIDFLDLEATIAKTLRHIEFLRNARECQAAAEHAYASLSRYFKQLGTRVCVSASLADKVKSFRGRPIGDLVLRGKTEPLRVFEPLRAEQYGDTANKSYLDAFAKLEAGGTEAIAAFAAHVGQQPKDQLASFHLKRLLNGATGTRIALD